MDVDVQGPFALAGTHAPIVFADAIANESGLYVWTVPYVGGGLIVTYVGETQSSFGQRMKEHAIQTLGGNYRVSDPDQLCQGVDAIVWPGSRDVAIWKWTKGEATLKTDFGDPLAGTELRALRV